MNSKLAILYASAALSVGTLHSAQPQTPENSNLFDGNFFARGRDPEGTIKPKKPKNDACNPAIWTLEARGAAFLPLQDKLSKLYGTAIPAIEVETSFTLAKSRSPCRNELQLWFNGTWAFQHNKSIGSGRHSDLDLVPISAGLSYQVNFFRSFAFYMGIGPTYSFLWIKNSNHDTTSHIRRNHLGFTTKTGFRFTFGRHFVIDLFGDYYYTQFRKMNHDPIQNIDRNFSAFFAGGAIGMKW